MAYLSIKKHRILFTGIVLLSCCLASFSKEDSAYTEYEVKAAILIKFTRFIDWPEESLPENGKEICIGILGQDPFGKILDSSLENQKIKKRPCRILRSEKREDLEGCHIVFVAASELESQKAILKHFSKKSILTIGETSSFCQQGGIINLLMSGGNIRFEINVDAAQRAGLKISSELLKLATVVRDDIALEEWEGY